LPTSRFGCLSPAKTLRYPLKRKLGGPQGPVCAFASARSRTGPPALSLSLHLLSYPGFSVVDASCFAVDISKFPNARAISIGERKASAPPRLLSNWCTETGFRCFVVGLGRVVADVLKARGSVIFSGQTNCSRSIKPLQSLPKRPVPLS